MKREDFEEGEERRPVRQPRATKREKKKMTIDELRASYTSKIQPLFHTYDRNVFLQIWRLLIVESGWTFKDVLNFISGSGEGNDQRDIFIAVALNDYIAHNDFPWKHWFFVEFPDIVRDLKMTWADPDIPYPWLRKSWERVRNNVTFQHEDDTLFVDVVWRSCYMWTAMFRRQCAKYYAHFYITTRQRLARTNADKTTTDWAYARQSVTIDEVDGRTEITYAQEDISKKKVVVVTYDLDEKFGRWRFGIEEEREGWADAYSVVAKAWVAWSDFWISARTGHGVEEYAQHWLTGQGERRFLHRSNVGKESGRDMEKMYTYNFTPQTVEAYIRWYCAQLVPATDTSIHLLGGGAHTVYQRKLFDSTYDKQTQRHQLAYYIEDTSVMLGFLKYHAKTGEEQWPLLDRLPMCPRRIYKRDPEKRAVQFLGARDLGE
jgi:hypothetical protein